MHGVDWPAVRENYRQFLPYITDNYAFQELLSEMLGELNGSHTGGRYYDGTGVSIGYVGVLFDPAFDGPGLKIAEFLPGSELLTSAPSLKEGDIIMSIDAKPIPAGQPWYKAFERKAGKRVLLTIKSGKDEVKLYITPLPPTLRRFTPAGCAATNKRSRSFPAAASAMFMSKV